MPFPRSICILIFAFIFFSCKSIQSENRLKSILEEFVSSTKTDIGISIVGPENDIPITINGDKLYPMLSTFKFPIALAVLNKVEKGELTLQQEIFISKVELLENTWSPFRNKFPNGELAISIEEAIMWMIVHSDNNITDILIRLLGGEKYIEEFIGNENIIIKNNENDMHKDWDSQFINQATPNEYTRLLKSFSDGKILSKENTDWLYNSMVNSTTGIKRLKGKLPNVIIAQRAGTSFTSEDGINGAINNAGIIELPNNKKVFISVFIRNNKTGFEKGEEMIADIGKIVFDYYTQN